VIANLEMSSWANRSANITKRKIRVPNYTKLDLSSGDIHGSLMNMLALYIYNQKMGERCFIVDEAQFLPNFINQNPQIQILKEVPEDSTALSVSDARPLVSNLKFPEIQKFAGSVFFYRSDFNGAILDVLMRNGIRSSFDIGVHVVPDASGSITSAVQLVKAYQTKTKRPSLSIFVAADTSALVQSFIKQADPTWRVSHVNKTSPKTADEFFITRMAEVQVLSTTPALVLDYQSSQSRYVYLMHRNIRELEYLKTTTQRSWSLV
jgi:hypothetical protein